MCERGKGGSADLRGDGNLGPCLLLNFLQVSALLPNQPAYEAVVGEDFQRDVLRPTQKNEVRPGDIRCCSVRNVIV